MKKFLVLLLLLPFFSFTYTTGDDLFFGDSITFGNELGSLQYTNRWSTQYCNAVSSNEDNRAQSGATMTPGLNAGRPVFDINAVPTYQTSYKHIFVSYWVNDFFYGGTPGAYATATTNAVNGILAKGWPASKIVLCFNYLPSVTISQAEALTWRAALKTVKVAKATSFLDFYTAIYNMPNNATYAGDGIHPTAAWNAVMAALAQTNIEAPGAGNLPATLLSFAGLRQGNSTTIKWTVAQEQNVQSYNIERSENGRNWNTIGTIASLGNTSTQRTYNFSDNNSSGARQQYRLRIVDSNGAIKFSNIIIVGGTKSTVLALNGLFPNPTTSDVNLIIEAPVKDNITITVLDAMGHLTKTLQAAVEAGSNTVGIDLSHTDAGSYLVRVTCTSNCQPVVSKFIKE